MIYHDYSIWDSLTLISGFIFKDLLLFLHLCNFNIIYIFVSDNTTSHIHFIQTSKKQPTTSNHTITSYNNCRRISCKFCFRNVLFWLYSLDFFNLIYIHFTCSASDSNISKYLPYQNHAANTTRTANYDQRGSISIVSTVALRARPTLQWKRTWENPTRLVHYWTGLITLPLSTNVEEKVASKTSWDHISTVLREIIAQQF